MSEPWFYILGVIAIFALVRWSDAVFGDGGSYDRQDDDFWDYEDRMDARAERRKRRRRRG